MASITTRAGKGSPLTNAELDANFNNINAQLSTAVITGGTIDGATIGATTATTGKFSQLDVDNLRLDANTISSTDTNGNVTITPNGTGEVTISKLNVTGIATLANGAVLGTPASGTVTNLTGTASININGTVGATTATTGAFTTATATTGNITTVNATTVDTTNVEVTNIKAKDGTASISLADTTGIATFSKATVVSTTGNTNAALRITQLGTGNALLVEDSANPDSTPVAIDASGNVLVGITTAQTINTLTPAFQQLGAGNYGSIWSGRYSANATGNGIYLSKSRSSTVGTNTILQSGDDLGTLFFFGADGTDLIQAASILAEVDGTPGTNDMPGRLVFSTTADGAATPTERVRIDSSGNVGIGTSSPSAKLQVSGDATANTFKLIANTTVSGSDATIFRPADNTLAFSTNGAERARIDSSGNLLVGKTSSDFSVAGFEARVNKEVYMVRDGDTPCQINRLTNDGALIGFYQATTLEGTISVSGSTVSYNGGHLSRWAQTTTAKDDTLVKGTVLSNLDEMNVYVDADGNPVENEQLNKVKVSDVEGDANVAGVFVNWTHDDAHDVDEINMAMTGDMIIRIAQGTTVARGDLLMSAGDGTAKPQGDDIVRSKTVAKVTSTHVTCTYADGSYCVPCVLMAC